MYEIRFFKHTRQKRISVWRRVMLVLLCLAAAGLCVVFGINACVRGSTAHNILSPEEAANLKDIDCILVLGCQVRTDGTPSDMLRDRLQRGVELYQQNTAAKLLMSGDHGGEDYNEVGTMKQYALDEGVPSSDVFMDHAGFSTYESVYRAKSIFGADRVVIVTQKYHLYRALYTAKKLGLTAYGVASDYHTYRGQSVRELREILARCKDFVTSILQPTPTYLGDQIPISGNGDVTNDR